MSENTINNRIELIMRENKLNFHSLGKMLDISDVVVRNIIKGRNKPSFDFTNKLILTFDCINAEWLITGRGEMLKKDVSDNKKSDCEKILLENKYLKKEIESLKKEAELKDQIIELLKGNIHKKPKRTQL